MWENSLDVQSTSTEGYVSVPQPSDEMLDDFERAQGFCLPHSYREFVKIYGAGVISGYYRIASPMDSNTAFELARRNANTHGDPEENRLELWDFGSQTEHCYFFGSNAGGDFYGWLLTEKTDEKRCEYAIYLFKSSCRVVRLCDTFFDFVEGYILKKRKGWTPERTYLRFSVEE